MNNFTGTMAKSASRKKYTNKQDFPCLFHQTEKQL